MLLLLAVTTLPLAAQTDREPSSQPITAEGVARASALVDSVFIDRVLPRATVEGGDFTAYLMARLGVQAIPPDFAYRVTVDTTGLCIGGRITDLPREARAALAQMVFLLPPETRLEGRVELHPAGKEAVRFHLAGATVHGVPVPEAVFAPLMADVGRQYPTLTATGRDLFVQIPAGASLRFVVGGVELIGP
jgi:hypothetical protein